MRTLLFSITFVALIVPALPPGSGAHEGARHHDCDCCAVGKKSSTSPSKGVEGEHSCALCGMDREQFAHSRMLIEYGDGTIVSTCSLNCAAVDMADRPKSAVKSLRVGDYSTKELIDARQAVWVIGGAKNGVMSPTPTWAFGSRERGEAFTREDGGKIATFDDALAAAFEALDSDGTQVREKLRDRERQKEQGR
jgi:copper chaperone NosL